MSALTDMIQGQMRDLTALSASVAELGTGQTNLAAGQADLNRKLDLLINAPAATRKPRPAREAKEMVVDLVSTGASAALEEGPHHAEAPEQKLARLAGAGATDGH